MIQQQTHLHNRNQNHSRTPNGSRSDADLAPAHNVHEAFRKFSQKASTIVGTPWAFAVAVAAVAIWAALGHFYHYSDTWQLVINTATTIVTFLMVFLIQNTQNRDARAIHLKLDELIRGNKRARNWLVELQDCTDEELDQIEKEFERLRDKSRRGETEFDPEHAARAQEAVETIADSPTRG